MGSSYFYLEFLLAWISLLKTSGFENPAIFSLEYTLVPDSSYPTQLEEAIAGYKHVLSIVQDSSKVCVGGDSAGATLVLSLLLHLGSISPTAGPVHPLKSNDLREMNGAIKRKVTATTNPGMAVLISPWVKLQSDLDKNTPSDYLDANNLHHYALQYAGPKTSVNDPLISPGNCKSLSWWKKACPIKGFFVTIGSDEVIAPETRKLVNLWEDGGIRAKAVEEKGGIHAWPVVELFLSNTKEERQKGLRVIVQEMRERMGS